MRAGLAEVAQRLASHGDPLEESARRVACVQYSVDSESGPRAPGHRGIGRGAATIEGEGFEKDAFVGIRVGRISCLTLPAVLRAQEQRRASIDVDHYKSMRRSTCQAQTLQATAAVTFVPQESGSSSGHIRMHNALSVSKVVDEQGRNLETNRSAQDYTVKVFFLNRW